MGWADFARPKVKVTPINKKAIRRERAKAVREGQLCHYHTLMRQGSIERAKAFAKRCNL